MAWSFCSDGHSSCLFMRMPCDRRGAVQQASSWKATRTIFAVSLSLGADTAMLGCRTPGNSASDQ